MSEFHTKNFMHVKNITLMVKDIQKSLAFYTQSLGMKLLNHTGDTYELGTHTDHKLVTLINNPLALPKQRSTGLYHFALLLPNRNYLGQMIKHFIKTQLPVTGGSDHGISEALYLDDPDQQGIELYADRDKASWPPLEQMGNAPMDYQDLVKNAVNEPYVKIPDDTIMGHLHLHVSDISFASKFFEDVLGFQTVVDYGPSAHFISDQGYHHHIGYNLWMGKNIPNNPPNAVGLKSYELHVPSLKFDSIVNALIANKIDIHKENDTIWIYDVNHVKVYLAKDSE